MDGQVSSSPQMKQVEPGHTSRIPTFSLFQVLRDPLGAFTRIAREQGDLAQFRFGNRIVYLLSHPDLVREVMVERHEDYVKSRSLRVIRRMTGDGLLVTEGEFHKNQRKLIQPSFNHQRVVTYLDTMSEFAVSEVDSWQNGSVFDVSSRFRRLAMAIVVKVLFGVDVRESGDVLENAFATSLAHTLSQYYMRTFYFNQDRNPIADIIEALPTRGNRKYRTASRLVEDTMTKIIDDRRKDGRAHDDLLDVLIHAKGYIGDRPLSSKQIRDEAITFFMAGLDTTATSLSWAVFLLAQNPEQEMKLQEEVDAVLEGEIPTPENMGSLQYTENVLLEAMRLYPPVWLIGRQAVRDTRIGKARIARGDTVLFSQWVLHRDPRFFQEPNSFKPERWSVRMKDQLPKFAYFPFGGGSRGCVGEPLAKAMGKLILATLSSRWRLKLSSKDGVVPQPRIILHPKNGVRVILERRMATAR